MEKSKRFINDLHAIITVRKVWKYSFILEMFVCGQGNISLNGIQIDVGNDMRG
jgi:hypothetical protein